MKSFAVLLVLGSICAAASAEQPKSQTETTRPTVLVTATSETDSTTNVTGGATNVGHVVVGGAGSQTDTYIHSNVWEVVRRLDAECQAATFVTNPRTPHTLTIHTDYEVHNGGFLMGNFTLYQLVLLDGANNPVWVSRKDWLRHEIKPICKAIQRQKH